MKSGTLRRQLSTHHAQQTIPAAHNLRLRHLQHLATWASSIPPLAAFLGFRLASTCQALACPPPPSPYFSCQRCESLLQPGFNCTVRILKRRRSKSHTKSPINYAAYICHFCGSENRKQGTPKDHVKTKLTEVAARDKLKNLGQETASSTPHVLHPSIQSVVKATSQHEANSDGSSRKRRRKGWSSLKDLVASQHETSITCSPLGLLPASQVPLSRFSERLELYSKSPYETPRSTAKYPSFTGPPLCEKTVMDSYMYVKDESLQVGFDGECCHDDANIQKKTINIVDDAGTSSNMTSVGKNSKYLETMIQEISFDKVQEELEQGPTTQGDSIERNAECVSENQGMESVFRISETQNVAGQPEGNTTHMIQNKDENENIDVERIPIDDIAMPRIVDKDQYDGNVQASFGLICRGLGHERQNNDKLVTSEAAVQCSIPSVGAEKHIDIGSQDNLQVCSMTNDENLGTSGAALQCSILSDNADRHGRVQNGDLERCLVAEKRLIKSFLTQLRHIRRVTKCAKKSKTRNGYLLNSSPILKLPCLLGLQGEIQCLSEQLDILKNLLDQMTFKVAEANCQNIAVTSTEFQQKNLPESPPERALKSESLPTDHQPSKKLVLQGELKAMKEHLTGPNFLEHSDDMDLPQKQRCQDRRVLSQENYNLPSLNQQFLLHPYGASKVEFTCRSPNHLKTSKSKGWKSKFPVLQKIGRRWIPVGKRDQKSNAWKHIMILYCTRRK